MAEPTELEKRQDIQERADRFREGLTKLSTDCGGGIAGVPIITPDGRIVVNLSFQDTKYAPKIEVEKPNRATRRKK